MWLKPKVTGNLTVEKKEEEAKASEEKEVNEEERRILVCRTCLENKSA